MAKLNEENIENKENVATDDKKEKKKVEKLNEEVAQLKADVEHWKNEYYRAYADTKNLRSNLEKEQQTIKKYRAEGFIEELLPVLDSFHMALSNEPTDPALKNYLTGFQFIYKNLVAVLENEGVKEIAPNVDDKFDDKTMNAVDAVESDGESNRIIKVYSKGYQLYDRLVRPANVSVSKKKEEKSTEANNKDNADA